MCVKAGCLYLFFCVARNWSVYFEKALSNSNIFTLYRFSFIKETSAVLLCILK
jgi:hypothetical protein